MFTCSGNQLPTATGVAPDIYQTASNACDHFFDTFDCLVATSETERLACFRTRHNVYCEEFGFEPERHSKLETDEFDQYSVHCLIRHKCTKEVAGTVRLIVPEYASQPLPVERLFKGIIANRACVPSEVSRLAIQKAYRRKGGQLFSSQASVSDYISLVLFIMAAHTFNLLSRTEVYVVMELSLARRIQSVGFKLEQIAKPIDHRGLRAPYKMCVKQVLHDLSCVLQPFYSALQSHISETSVSMAIPPQEEQVA
ncbi:PEP-CTERM/exosortase system-associated acyltransferase [Alteromonas sediminis]|uniref:PEP-CTERM/exosortase system-associated acyltransferase n=1 Tax=Alteromonas sediminis TaxID=2259342 RepID=A0A3N5Y6X0_9ALTE|nr:PEP-CTERM/exosortase system-associated acyltransferase [Alteromonas sediminis]RPJ66309.1 PEP-CTERM/exosortase system-associated acyltransferase [Alteromonas sediminis]